MIVTLIAAVSENGGIGFQGQIPWRLSTDLKMFKQSTMGHTLIQGRTTYESIGKPLPGRKMVVITRQRDYEVPGCTVVHSLGEALSLAEEDGETEAFIGGGAGIYAEALPLAGRMILSRVHAVVEADTYFPAFDEGEWTIIQEDFYRGSEENGDQHDFTRQILERKQPIKQTA